TLAELAALGVTLLPQTTAFGLYDHNLIALNQRASADRPEQLWRIRAERILLATGAIDRPLPFDRNDLPGVISAHGALTYLKRYGVLVGEKIVLASNNSAGAEAALALAAAGAEVTLVDYRSGGVPLQAKGLRHLQ